MYLEQTYETNKTIDLNLNHMTYKIKIIAWIYMKLLLDFYGVAFKFSPSSAWVEQHGRRRQWASVTRKRTRREWEKGELGCGRKKRGARRPIYRGWEGEKGAPGSSCYWWERVTDELNLHWCSLTRDEEGSALIDSIGWANISDGRWRNCRQREEINGGGENDHH
jgi:hypothetical protein